MDPLVLYLVVKFNCSGDEGAVLLVAAELENKLVVEVYQGGGVAEVDAICNGFGPASLDVESFAAFSELRAINKPSN